MSYLWQLILNIMISIIACTAAMQHTLPGAPAACCAAVAAAAQQRWAAAQRHGMPQFSACRAGLQPSEPKKIAKAGLLAVEVGQQAWAGWGGRA